MKSSLPAPTLAEQTRIEQMLRLGCVACASIGIPNGQRIECHHILEGNVKLGHLYTIPLCSSHHRSVEWELLLDVIEPRKMVAIADGRKAFTRVYPDERTLWETVQKKLKLPTDWPLSKIYPRAVG